MAKRGRSIPDLGEVDVLIQLIPNPDHQMFVREYLVDLCGSKAAIRAGYAKPNAGQIACNMLQRPDIKAAVDAYIKQRAIAANATVDRVFTELACLAFSDMSHFVDWDGSRFTVFSLADIPKELTPAIKKIAKVITRDGERFEIELYDKTKALDMLGKYHSMWSNNKDDEGDESYAAAFNKLIDRLPS